MIVSLKTAVVAAKLLRLELEELTPDGIQDAYRAMAKLTHPDAGGSMEQFAAVDRAKHILLAWLQRPAAPPNAYTAQACERCGGTGVAKVTRGFRTYSLMCQACRGSGDADYDKHGEHA